MPHPVRTAAEAREAVLGQLEADHLRVKAACRAFEALAIDAGPRRGVAIVLHVLDELTVHAALEEGFLYPAARGFVEDRLLDEAELAHESLHGAIEPLRKMHPGEVTPDAYAGYAACFRALGAIVLRHFEAEESDLFPRLRRTTLDWQALAEEMSDRRESLARDPRAEADLEAGPRDAGAPPTTA